jgi:hypothetical protein
MQPLPDVVLPLPWVWVVVDRAFVSGHGPRAHPRSAVGIAGLPFDIPAEIEAEVAIRHR